VAGLSREKPLPFWIFRKKKAVFAYFCPKETKISLAPLFLAKESDKNTALSLQILPNVV